MKKTLIALAALAATGAFAQNVTVTGTLDATFRSTSTKYGTGLENKQTALGKDGIGTSGFTLSGNEDLGGGLKAVFLYELNFNPADTGTADTGTGALTPTGAALSTGQVFVGVESGLGTFRLGAPNQATWVIQSTRGMAFGTKDGGRAGLITGAGGAIMGVSQTRQDGSIQYVTPNFSGFSAHLTFIPANETAATTASVNNGKQEARTDLGLFYANGPISAGVALYNEGALKNAAGTTTTGKYELNSFFASYNFGVARVLLGGNTAKQSTGATVNVDASSYNIGVEAPITPALTATLNFQSLDDKRTANNDTTMTAVGLQYALSKRTTTYVRYVTQSVDNVTTVTTAKDADRFLVGLRHNF